MEMHRMWTHRARGGIYEVLGCGLYKGTEAIKDMGKVLVTRIGAAWGELNAVPEHYTIVLTQLVDEAVVQIEKASMLKPDEQIVVYRGSDGKVWVRPVKDFYDGRFQKLDDNLQKMEEAVKDNVPDPE